METKEIDKWQSTGQFLVAKSGEVLLIDRYSEDGKKDLIMNSLADVCGFRLMGRYKVTIEKIKDGDWGEE